MRFHEIKRDLRSTALMIVVSSVSYGDVRPKVKESGQGEWSRRVVNESGQGEWSRRVVKESRRVERAIIDFTDILEIHQQL